jgi:hypothetical protein
MSPLHLFAPLSIALSAVAMPACVAAVPTDDVFTGTLSVEQGQLVLTRCDAVGNRYVLIDRRDDQSGPLPGAGDDVYDVIGTASDDAGAITLTVQSLTARKPRPMCHLTEVEAMFAPVAPEPVDPNETFDLAALIECRADAATAARFRNWLQLGPEVVAAASLTKVSGHNFVSEYRIGTPVTVFGHPTTTLALHPDGLLAILSDIAPQVLAQDLGATPMLSTDPFIAHKIMETPAAPGAMPGEVAVRVQVVTSRDGLEGKAVAGCLYLSTREGNF